MVITIVVSKFQNGKFDSDTYFDGEIVSVQRDVTLEDIVAHAIELRKKHPNTDTMVEMQSPTDTVEKALADLLNKELVKPDIKILPPLRSVYE